MKVAQIVCTFPPYRGGIGNSVYNFAEILSQLNYEITVFTPDYGYKIDDEFFSITKNKYKIERLKPLIKIGNAAILPQLFFKLKDFDIIHLHYPFYGTAEIVLLKKIFSIKKTILIIHYHMDANAKGIKGTVFNIYKILILPLLARFSNLITCASLDYIKHSFLAPYYKKHPEKFRQTLFGVNTEQFITYHDDKNKYREEKIILFVGGLDRAHYFKGLEILIKSLAKLRNNPKFKNTVLKIVGEGELKQYYNNLAIKLNLKKFVHFYNKVDDSKLVDYYNYCDVVVLPSINKSEAFGLVLLEAMSASKPVIASNLPGVRSVFKNESQGFLVKPGNVADLASKLSKILSDDKLAKKMGERGRQLVEKKYTWEKVGKRLDIIYNYIKYVPKLSYKKHENLPDQ